MHKFMIFYTWTMTIIFTAFAAHELALEQATRETRQRLNYKLENCNKIISGPTK